MPSRYAVAMSHCHCLPAHFAPAAREPATATCHDALPPSAIARYPIWPDKQQICRETNADHESHYSPRRHRERRHSSRGPARSRSPVRPESSRKHRRSHSPRLDTNLPYNRPGKRTREGMQRSRTDKPEFFRSGAGPRGGVCAICLGRHDHTFSKCDGSKLWNGSPPGAAKKNEQGRLVAADGFPLCFDWQVPKGCTSASHPDRHRCSGCGKSDHGAQTCPRAEKV